MTLQETIELDLKQALKTQDIPKRDLLRVLIVEITKKNKIASDEEVIRCIKKQIESAKLCKTEWEIPLLTVYLPKEFSTEELIEVLSSDAFKGLDFKSSMIKAKEVLGSNFDGKKVSEILKKTI